MRKSDKFEYEKRLRAVQEWILSNYSSGDIVKQCMQSWGVKERQSRWYMEKAYELFRLANQEDSESLLAGAIERRKKLSREMDADERKTASGTATLLAIERDIDKLRGLYVTKHEVSGPGGKPIATQTVQKIDYSQLPTEVLEAIIHASTSGNHTESQSEET
jgi:hypothetical protein